MRYLEVMDASQCVTHPGSYGRKFWTQVNALSGSYGRQTMCYLLVMDASQGFIW